LFGFTEKQNLCPHPDVWQKSNGSAVAKSGLFGGFANVASKASERTLSCPPLAACWGVPQAPGENPNGFIALKPSRCSVYTASLRLRKR